MLADNDGPVGRFDWSGKAMECLQWRRRSDEWQHGLFGHLEMPQENGEHALACLRAAERAKRPSHAKPRVRRAASGWVVSKAGVEYSFPSWEDAIRFAVPPKRWEMFA